MITNDIQTLKSTTFNLLTYSILHVMFESKGKMTERRELNYHINLGWVNRQTLLLTQKTPLLVEAGEKEEKTTVKNRHGIKTQKVNENYVHNNFLPLPSFIWRETFHNLSKFNKSHVKIYQIIRTIYNVQRDLNGGWVRWSTRVVAGMLFSGWIYY